MTLTSREFNQDTARAKRATLHGPVIITDRGVPSHVLVSYPEYQRLSGANPDFIAALGSPDGVENVEYEFPQIPDYGRAAQFL